LGDARNLGIRDEVNGVSAAGVLGDTIVRVVRFARDGVVGDVLENGTEANGVEDLGLLFGVETDALGVATTLNVEDTVVRPDMLVVTNQLSPRVRRKGPVSGTSSIIRMHMRKASGDERLASAGKTEKERHIAVLALVGRRVQGKLAELDRLQVVL
jgi:hypothetical protein